MCLNWVEAPSPWTVGSFFILSVSFLGAQTHYSQPCHMINYHVTHTINYHVTHTINYHVTHTWREMCSSRFCWVHIISFVT